MNTVQLHLGEGAALVVKSVGQPHRCELKRRLAAIQRIFQQEAKEGQETLEKHQRAWTVSHQQEQRKQAVLELARRARADFDVLVTVGIGGSDLGARVLHDVLNHPYHNQLTEEERGGAPQVFFTGDTFDPHRLVGLLDVLEKRNLLKSTLFNVVSKSGTTPETIAAAMVIRERLGDNWRDQIVATTGQNEKSVLFNENSCKPFYGMLPVPEGVGGRFSVVSPVGLFLLAMTANEKVETPEARRNAALDGLAEADALFNLPSDDPANVAYRLAEWLHLAEVWAQKKILVFYHYADHATLGDWFVQLYDESLQERGGGLTVLATRGPTGNHSLLNGIIGGPRDKAVVFVTWRDMGKDLRIPQNTGICEMEVFEGLDMSLIQRASYEGTAEDFTAHGVPNVTIEVERRDTKSLFALFRVLMDAVAVKGKLQGLHFDDSEQLNLARELTYYQDWVEGYKVRTKEKAAAMKME